MKTIGRITLGLGAALLIAAPAMAALDEPIQAKVPFSFVVEQKTLPAGTYIVEPADNSDPTALVLRTPDNKQRVVILAEESDMRVAPDRSELVFDEVGGKYFLCQVWQAGSLEGNALPKNESERALEKTRSMGHGHRSVMAKSMMGMRNG